MFHSDGNTSSEEQTTHSQVELVGDVRQVAAIIAPPGIQVNGSRANILLGSDL